MELPLHLGGRSGINWSVHHPPVEEALAVRNGGCIDLIDLKIEGSRVHYQFLEPSGSPRTAVL